MFVINLQKLQHTHDPQSYRPNNPDNLENIIYIENL